jgi:signal peptidase II
LRDFDILEKLELLGYMLILGGAFGNFLDRISNGSVLDFIIINYNRVYFPAVFNVADILISFGAFLIIYSFLFIKKND